MSLMYRLSINFSQSVWRLTYNKQKLVGVGKSAQRCCRLISSQETAIQRSDRRRLREERKQKVRDKFLEAAAKKKGLDYEVTPVVIDEAGKKVLSSLPNKYSVPYVESSWYEWWEKQGYFKPDATTSSFVMCLPPPNVTGSLHLGHALGATIQDAIVRWKKMRGESILWVPGLDHGGSATQTVVEKHLKQTEGLDRNHLDATDLRKRAQEWKILKGESITNQLRRMGCALDWSRENFTLDPKMEQATTAAFIKLHKKGLIYRGSRIINWSCALQSTVSDMEVEIRHLKGRTWITIPNYERDILFGEMHYLDYPVFCAKGRSKGAITIATTRVETVLGDVAIAVHPDDDRYKHLHGGFAQHPLCDRVLPIVADRKVEPSVGSGAMKVTPALSLIDREIGMDHQLESIDILDDLGQLTNVPPKYQGLPRYEARDKILENLKAQKAYAHVEEHSMGLPLCSRTGDVIEQRFKEHWFLDSSQLARDAIQAITNGEIGFIPDNHVKQWVHLLNEVGAEKWCLSRQLWWGHRIPAFRHKNKDSEWIIGEKEQLENMDDYEQDPDVFDTWFSSALIPFAAMGWPDKTSDYQYKRNIFIQYGDIPFRRFYPNDLLVTGFDIMLLWVARMVMLSKELTGEVPFKNVLYHGLVRDAKGAKMSKSLGNVIDPIDIVNGISLKEMNDKLKEGYLNAVETENAAKYQRREYPRGIASSGADALRFSLLDRQYKDHVIKFDPTTVENKHRFCNKIWQAFRFASAYDGNVAKVEPRYPSLHPMDKWILSRLARCVETCNQGFKSYDLHLTTKALYRFMWLEFCDTYLEFSKTETTSPQRKDEVKSILFHCFDTFVRLLSPVMPFVSEELYQRLPTIYVTKESVCLEQYPQYGQPHLYSKEHDLEVEPVLQLIHDLSTARVDAKKPVALKPTAYLPVDTLEKLRPYHGLIKLRARCTELCVTEPQPPQEAIQVDSDVTSAYLVFQSDPSAPC